MESLWNKTVNLKHQFASFTKKWPKITNSKLPNRPKTSPNLNFCSIIITHRATDILWLCTSSLFSDICSGAVLFQFGMRLEMCRMCTIDCALACLARQFLAKTYFFLLEQKSFRELSRYPKYRYMAFLFFQFLNILKCFYWSFKQMKARLVVFKLLQ